MKISIIGATHAGTFATMQILKDHPDYDVTVFERNDNVSFLSCGIALWVGNHIADPNKMFYSSPVGLPPAVSCGSISRILTAREAP